MRHGKHCWKHGLLALAVATLAAGCDHFGVRPGTPPAPAAPAAATTPIPEGELDALIRDAADVYRLPPAELAQRTSAAEQRLQATGGAPDRLRLALLLGAARNPDRDPVRARALLVRAADGPGADSAYTNLATWALGMLDAQSHLEDALADERRARLTLQKKLNALKTIEENLNERSRPNVIEPK